MSPHYYPWFRSLATLLVIASAFRVATAIPLDTPTATVKRGNGGLGGTHWVDTWGCMPQLTEPSNLPNPPFNQTGLVFNNSTIRQTIHTSIGSAEWIRIRISNAFGATDLPITAMTVALPAPNASSAGSSEIQLGTLQTVTFSGNESILIPDGSLAVSDPLRFPVAPQSELSISIYLANGQQGNSITSHPGSRINIFYSFGDYTRAFNLTDPSTQSVAHWYFLSALEAWTPPQSSAFNIVGDSITDGRGSTTDENNRWPDLLYARMAEDPATSDIAVINEAAGGNCVLTDGPTTGCLGPNALGRLDRDVLAQSGVKYAMIFEGVNDIGTASTNATAQDEIYDRLIQAYEQMITRVHTFRIPFFGATITPFMAPNSTIQPYSQPAYDVTRQRVNAWIRTSGKFDAVFDFDAVVRDPANPQQIAPQYNSGDYLHMNPAGYQAIADSIDLGVFQQFANGVNGFTR